jgi:O-antigen/teichoic acid export membrane protein
MIGMRWTDRLIGFVSTLILARLLVPEDFGIIAMASIVVGLADMLLDMGVNIALIQNSKATQEDYNAAWTIRLIQSVLGTLLVFFLAQPAAEYFRDERVADVIQILAFSLLITGCENIGIVSFQKKMEFGREFSFLFIKRVAGFVVTIGAAFLLHSYWAMVIGALSGRMVGTLLSYILHPMRPRLSLARVKPILSFSTWNLARSIGAFLIDNLHRFLVGRRESAGVTGAYALGCDIAAMPSSELLAPLGRVLFPLFVKMKDDLSRLKEAYLLALGILALVGVPAGTGMVLVARELVLALLGDKWMAAVPFIQIVGVISILNSIGVSGVSMLLALGRAKITALNAWLQILLFAVLGVIVFPEGGAMTIALLRLVAGIAGIMFLAALLMRELPILRLAEMLGAVWRPCLASLMMAIVLLSAPIPADIPLITQLLAKVLLGAVTYAICQLGLWRLTDCSYGPEAYLLGKFRYGRMVLRMLGKPPAA